MNLIYICFLNVAEWLCISFPSIAWEQFRDLIPENERGCFVDAYHKRLNSDDLETQVWFLWLLVASFLFELFLIFEMLLLKVIFIGCKPTFYLMRPYEYIKKHYFELTTTTTIVMIVWCWFADDFNRKMQIVCNEWHINLM